MNYMHILYYIEILLDSLHTLLILRAGEFACGIYIKDLSPIAYELFIKGAIWSKQKGEENIHRPYAYDFVTMLGVVKSHLWLTCIVSKV